MTWVLFDELDRRSPGPSFRLPSLLGGQVGLSDYRGYDNLVLFFTQGMEYQAARAGLRAFATHKGDFDRLETVVLAILPEPVEILRLEPELFGLPYPVLSDVEGKTRRRFADQLDKSLVTEGDCLVFVLDQYGAPYAALAEKRVDDPGLQRELLQWLEYIEMQCPE